MENPFVVYVKNLGPSGTSVYPPLANLYIDIEAFLSLIWEKIIIKSNASINSLAPSYKIIRKFTLGLFHFLFSIFLYKKILKYAPSGNKSRAFIAFLIWLFNPLSLLVGTVWGQLDEIMVILIFLCLYFLSKKKITVSAILLAAAVLFKLQGIIILPVYLFGLTAITYTENKGKINKKFLRLLYTKLSISGFTFILIFTAFSLPFIKYDREGYFRFLTNLRIFPFVHMNGFNMWMFLFGNKVQVNDNEILVRNLSHHTIGISIFIFLSINVLIVSAKKFVKEKIKLSYYHLIEILYLTYGAFFLFMTEIHERYIVYMYLPFLLLFIFKYLKGKLHILEYIQIIVFTLVSASNLLLVLYQDKVLNLFRENNIDFLVRTLSVIVLYSYLISIIFLRNTLKQR